MEEKEAQKDERYRVAVTQGDIREIKRDVTDLAQKVGEVHAALIGSPLVKDGGIVKRLSDCEASVELLLTKVQEAENAGKRRDRYINWIWGLVSFIVGSVFVELLRYFSNKK